MLHLTIYVLALIQAFRVKSTDADVVRDYCFTNHEKNCDTDFVDAYKDLSRSVIGELADTYFLLYTRRNPDEPEKLHKCAGKLPPNSNFNPNNRIIFLCPSYLTHLCGLEPIREWKDEILKREDANVIGIDFCWHKIDFADTHANVRLVARQTATVLDNIKEQTGVEKLNILAIGLSLGAQLAGHIGKIYDVDRIIALDPGGPLFNNAPESERLNPNDAKLVEAWYCNAGGLGATYDAGHYNFYINGGVYQKSCHVTNLKAIAEGKIFLAAGTLIEPACSHIQCAVYFKDTINPTTCQHVGVNFDDNENLLFGNSKSCGPNGEYCFIMGYDAEKYAKEIPQKRQRMYVETNLDSPYCVTDKDYVDLDGYEAIYKSSLPKKISQEEGSKIQEFQ